MADIVVQASLQVNKMSGDLTQVLVREFTQPTTFTADMIGESGPYVGAVVAQLTHTNLDLSVVLGGGLCWVMNQDEDNFVTLGIYDQLTNQFIPYQELLPGEITVIRLSRYIGTNLDPGTGTGTAGLNPSFWAVKADVAPCSVLFKVFPA